jgi:ankyrin repeat protein
MPSDALQALYHGDHEEAQRLLAADDELTIFDAAAFGRTDRLRALVAGDPQLVRAFSDDGFSPLHLALFGGQEEASRILIEAGADLNVRSTASFAQVPPLGTAIFVGSLQLVRLLLDAGADVNAEGEGGFTPLDSAVLKGDDELVRELEAHGGRRGPSDVELR